MSDEFVKHENEEVEVENTSNAVNSVKDNEKDKNNNEGSDSPIGNGDDNVNQNLMVMEDQYKRLLADYQNLQRRTAQEKEDIYKYASEKTLDALLPALDTMDYARSSFNAEITVERMQKDFNLILDMFVKCFNDTGVETIEEVGVPFNPVYHEPLQQIQTTELPPYTVMQVLKKGYSLNGKVIRPAMVSVSVEVNEDAKKD